MRVPDSDGPRAEITGREIKEPKKGFLSNRPGFRKRINPYYEGMTKKQIAMDTAKTTAKWAVGTVFLFAYWMAMLLLLSLFLLNVWHVRLVTLILYAVLLTVVSSAVYAAVLVHRKFYY